MDGAVKYVKGDASAGLLISAVNIIGGLAMGMLRNGMEFQAALDKYVILTIGDGLVSQIPSLLISLSTGILVTKGSKDADFGTVLVSQLFGVPKVLYFVGSTVIALGILTPLNTILFLILGFSFIITARIMSGTLETAGIDAQVEADEAAAEQEDRQVRRCLQELLKRWGKYRRFPWRGVPDRSRFRRIGFLRAPGLVTVSR